MYIVIYKNGIQYEVPLTRDTLEQVQAVGDEKYVFIWGLKNHKLNDPDGITFIGEDGKRCNEFKHESYVLRQVIKNENSKTFNFIFRNNGLDNSVEIKYGSISFAKALTEAIKEIILASKFNSWADYGQTCWGCF